MLQAEHHHRADRQSGAALPFHRRSVNGEPTNPPRASAKPTGERCDTWRALSRNCQDQIYEDRSIRGPPIIIENGRVYPTHFDLQAASFKANGLSRRAVTCLSPSDERCDRRICFVLRIVAGKLGKACCLGDLATGNQSLSIANSSSRNTSRSSAQRAPR